MDDDNMSSFYSGIGIPDMTGDGTTDAVDAILYEDMIRDTEYALTGRPISPTDPLYDPYYRPYGVMDEENEEEEDEETSEVDDILSVSAFSGIYDGYEYEDTLNPYSFIQDEPDDYDSGAGSDPDSMDYEFFYPLDPHDSF